MGPGELEKLVASLLQVKHKTISGRNVVALPCGPLILLLASRQSLIPPDQVKRLMSGTGRAARLRI